MHQPGPGVTSGDVTGMQGSHNQAAPSYWLQAAILYLFQPDLWDDGSLELT